MNAVAVAVKLPVGEPDATVTEPGAVSALLLLARVTLVPPAGAAWLRVTVQAVVKPGPTVAGVQVNELRVRVGVNVRTAACEIPPKLAVTVAV